MGRKRIRATVHDSAKTITDSQKVTQDEIDRSETNHLPFQPTPEKVEALYSWDCLMKNSNILRSTKR